MEVAYMFLFAPTVLWVAVMGIKLFLYFNEPLRRFNYLTAEIDRWDICVRCFPADPDWSAGPYRGLLPWLIVISLRDQ